MFALPLVEPFSFTKSSVKSKACFVVSLKVPVPLVALGSSSSSSTVGKSNVRKLPCRIWVFPSLCSIKLSFSSVKQIELNPDINFDLF